MSATQQALAVLGTGRMGAPIARNLLAAGFPVTVWNRTPERAKPLGTDGASIASSPAQAAEDAAVVLTMLADGAAVEESMSGSGGALETLRPGSVWIQMATVGVDWTERLEAVAADRGVEFVDAPVSGSDGPARDGELEVLASGPDEVRDGLQPIFDAIGRETLWLGQAGMGTRLKLVLNNWLATQVEAVARDDRPGRGARDRPAPIHRDDRRGPAGIALRRGEGAWDDQRRACSGLCAAARLQGRRPRARCSSRPRPRSSSHVSACTTLAESNRRRPRR
jgi:NAD binding domain of 6-phosphogluconate dehydrogenase